MNSFVEVPALPPEKAKAYWDNLKTRDIAPSYGEFPAQIGHPVELDTSLIRSLKAGARETHVIIQDKLNESGGVTKFIDRRAPAFGNYLLNNEAINEQLEWRLDRGYGLPFIYDTLLTRENGYPSSKVLEIQTGISYETFLAEWLQAAGYDPMDPRTRFGRENPETRYLSLSRRFANGEPIVVMDTDPFDGTRVDKAGMQHMVGRKIDFPISPLDISGKDSNGYYYYPYIVDPANPFDVARNKDGTPQKHTQRAYLNNVLARMSPPELDTLWKLVEHDIERRELIAQFLTDSAINWIWHPTWQNIADKSILPAVRQALLDRQSPLAEQFVPVYGVGQRIIEPGAYMRKPTDSKGGVGHSTVTIKANEKVFVDEGYIYQQVLSPFPVISHIQGKYAAAMRRQNQTSLRELDKQADEAVRPITGQLEIRCLMPPYWDEEAIGRYMTRFAPRWKDSDGTNLQRAQTNAKPAYFALHAHLDGIGRGEDYQFYPYGIAPVVVFDKSKE